MIVIGSGDEETSSLDARVEEEKGTYHTRLSIVTSISVKCSMISRRSSLGREVRFFDGDDMLS